MTRTGIFISGLITGMFALGLTLEAMAQAPPAPVCEPATVEGLDERMDRLEDLIWALHASEDRKRSALSDAGVVNALLEMRGEQRARQAASLQCYTEDR